MEWMSLLYQIIEVCVIPLLGILTAYIVKYINAKSEEIQMNIDDATMKKYVDMLADTITDCVIATNQTYVESLKQQGKFDMNAQREAFSLTSAAVMEILSDEAKVYLTAAVGDLNAYITQKIEAEVNINKK